MRLRLSELQVKDLQVQKIRSKLGIKLESRLKKDWEEIGGVLHHHGLLYVPEIIETKLVSGHHNDLLAGHFGMEKTWKLIAQKYN